MGDPFLNYFALGLLIFVVVVLFYGIIATRYPIPNRKVAQSPARRRHSRRRMGESVHVARDLALPLDLGNGLPARTRLGNQPPHGCQRRAYS
jgi:hypothetical protein